MGELINGRTPEEIKKWLNCLAFDCGYEMCGKCEYDELCKYPGTALLYAPDALALIERLEAEHDTALAKVPKWISVEERLPENGNDVLCWYEYYRYGDYNRMYQTYGIGCCWNGTWCGDVPSGSRSKVLYWMPLPMPPKEGA